MDAERPLLSCECRVCPSHAAPTPEKGSPSDDEVKARWASAPTPEAVERVAALEAALRDLLRLVDDGLLVRSTTNDAHFPSYMAESVRIVKAIQAAQQQIALADAIAAMRGDDRT